MFAFIVILLLNLSTSVSDSITVRLVLSPDEYVIIVDGDVNHWMNVSHGDTLRFPATTKLLTFTHPKYRDIPIPIRPSRDAVRPIIVGNQIPLAKSARHQSSWYAIRNRANVYVETDSTTTIHFGDEMIGKGSAWLTLPKGRRWHAVRFESEHGEVRYGGLTLDQRQTTQLVYYVRPSRANSYSRLLFPGATQWAERDKEKAVFISLMNGFALGLLVDSYFRYDRSVDRYNTANQLYRTAPTHIEAIQYAELAKRRYADMRDYNHDRKTFLVGLGVLYSLHLIDAIIPPKHGYRTLWVRPDPYEAVGVHLSF